MSRAYIVFGSDDRVSWSLLNTVEASSPEQAMNRAREQEAHRHYAAVPERNWSWATPQVVERPPVVKWTSISPAQMTVDDVVEPEPLPTREEEPVEEQPKQERRGVL
jgi:hypothetical protein